MTVKASEDIVALERVYVPDKKMKLHLEACSGDAEMNRKKTSEDFDAFESVNVPNDQMDLDVKAGCYSEEMMNFEDSASSEESSSVDENSRYEIQNDTDDFNNVDAKDMDASSKDKEAHSESTNAMTHFKEIYEFSSSEESSSAEENSEDEIQNETADFDSMDANLDPAMYIWKISN